MRGGRHRFGSLVLSTDRIAIASRRSWAAAPARAANRSLQRPSPGLDSTSATMIRDSDSRSSAITCRLSVKSFRCCAPWPLTVPPSPRTAAEALPTASASENCRRHCSSWLDDTGWPQFPSRVAQQLLDLTGMSQTSNNACAVSGKRRASSTNITTSAPGSSARSRRPSGPCRRATGDDLQSRCRTPLHACGRPRHGTARCGAAPAQAIFRSGSDQRPRFRFGDASELTDDDSSGLRATADFTLMEITANWPET